jgi:hypothetical protein
MISMNDDGINRIPNKLAKVIAGLTMLLGGALVVMAFFPVREFLAGGKEWMDCLITFMMVSLMLIPGAMVILGGYQFLREVSLPNLKVLVGAYSVIGAIWLSARFSDCYPDLWHQRIMANLLTLGTAVSGILIYLLALRVLMPVMGMNWAGCRSVLAKGAFQLLAWFLWMALFAIAHEMFRGDNDHYLGLLVLLGPISMAWGFYILAVNWLKAGQKDAMNPES